MQQEHEAPVQPPDQADVVIIGAGPAGMAAANLASRHGANVVVLDEQAAAGGQIYRGILTAPAARRHILGPDYEAGATLARSLSECSAQHFTSAAVWQITPDRRVLFTWQGGLHAISARRIILCTGAMERPFPIPGWTLPGVMTAGAAQILLKGSGMAPTGPVVLAGCGPLLYLLAAQYVKAGAPIAALVDTTHSGDYWQALRHLLQALKGSAYLRKGASLLSSLKRAGIPHYKGATQLRVVGEHDAQGLSFSCKGASHVVHSDVVLLHQGVVPNTQFSWSLCAEHTWDENQLCWRPVTDEWGELSVSGVFVAGDGRGITGAHAAALQGQLAAWSVLSQLELVSQDARDHAAASLQKALAPHAAIRAFLETLYRPKAENRNPQDDTIVCRCEEITAGQLRAMVAQGCADPNQAKSQSRCGMGPCQGRQCGLTVTEVIAAARGVSPAEVGHYRIRPPIKPVTLGELADAVH